MRRGRRLLPDRRDPIDLDWQTDAACTNVGHHPFFPVRGEVPPPDIAALCVTCPVFDACFEHAVRFERFGYWAGTSERQRRRIRAERRRVAERGVLVS